MSRTRPELLHWNFSHNHIIVTHGLHPVEVLVRLESWAFCHSALPRDRKQQVMLRSGHLADDPDEHTNNYDEVDETCQAQSEPTTHLRSGRCGPSRCRVYVMSQVQPINMQLEAIQQQEGAGRL